MNPETVQTIIDDLGALLLFTMILIIIHRGTSDFPRHPRRASRRNCGICPLKPQCCPKEPSRKIPRDIHERARDVARSFVGTEGFEQSRRERKKIEMRFAHIKRILRLDRLRLRGPRGAQDEFVLAAIAQD
jgi:hypothetical protein